MNRPGGTKAKRKPPSARRKAARGADDHSVTAEITLLLNTLRELAAIRSTAEDAAARILDSAEGLLALADKEEAEKAEEAIMSIMTACGFHDLVGQRVSKITETLDCVIASRLTGAEPERARAKLSAETGQEITLEGPSHNSAAQDQARIDALFAKKN
jgi:chemotaxis regulatin CheY-phosphate phosphatase CheZ